MIEALGVITSVAAVMALAALMLATVAHLGAIMVSVEALRSEEEWNWTVAWRCMRCSMGTPLANVCIVRETDPVKHTDPRFVCAGCGASESSLLQRWVGRCRYRYRTWGWLVIGIAPQWEWVPEDQLPQDLRTRKPL